MERMRRLLWLFGVVLAVAGLASCEAEEDGQSYYCVLSEESVLLRMGDQPVRLKATVLSNNEDETEDFDRSVQWRSGDESVATVDEYGLVSPVGPGTTTITATPTIGGKAAVCAVTVKKAPTFAWVRVKFRHEPPKSFSDSWDGWKRTWTAVSNYEVDKDDPNKITFSYSIRWDWSGIMKTTITGSATNVYPEVIREGQRLEFNTHLSAHAHDGTHYAYNSVYLEFDEPDCEPGFGSAHSTRFKLIKGKGELGPKGKDEFKEDYATWVLEKMFKGGKEGDRISLYFRWSYFLEVQYKWTQIDD